MRERVTWAGRCNFHLNAVVSTFDVRARSAHQTSRNGRATIHTINRALNPPASTTMPPACDRPKGEEAMALRFSKHGCARCARSQLPCRDGSPNAAATARTPIRWLHIPKCGATLAVSVLSYACSNSLPDWHIAGMAIKGGRIDVRMAHALDARRARSGARCDDRLLLPFAGHEPVSARDLSRGGLVAFFRRPAQRLISAYLDNRHAWGLRASERSSLKSAAPTIAAFARYPGIAGCATKMLAGFDCAANVSLRDGTVFEERSRAFGPMRLLLLALWRNGRRQSVYCIGRCPVIANRSSPPSATSATASTRTATYRGCRRPRVTASTMRAYWKALSTRPTSACIRRRGGCLERGESDGEAIDF